MVENGLFQFHLELNKYFENMKIRLNKHSSESVDDDDGDLRALTMEQVIRPFYLAVGLLAASVLVFIGEIIYFKWMARRDRIQY